MTGSCNDCSYCKFPGYPYCTKHGCRVNRDDCCADYKDPLDTLVALIMEEEKHNQQAQKTQIPRETPECHEPQRPAPVEDGPDVTPMLRYLGIGFVILCILAGLRLAAPFL